MNITSDPTADGGGPAAGATVRQASYFFGMLNQSLW